MKCRVANNGWWPVINCHFCVLTYQLFLYCSVNTRLIILSNFLFCVKIKPNYYYNSSTESVVRRCSVKKCVLRNSAKFTAKPLYVGVSFLIKLLAACSFRHRWPVINCHFCVLTYQLFLYCSVNTCLIILPNFLFYVKIKPNYYYNFSTESFVRRCSVKKCVLRNSAKFTAKPLYVGVSFLIKLLAACSFRHRLWHRHFPVNFAKFLRTSILKNWKNWREGRKHCLKQIGLLWIKVSGPLLKAFSKRYYLKAVELCRNDKNHWLKKKNQKKREM